VAPPKFNRTCLWEPAGPHTCNFVVSVAALLCCLPRLLAQPQRGDPGSFVQGQCDHAMGICNCPAGEAVSAGDSSFPLQLVSSRCRRCLAQAGLAMTAARA
jgi:hypothetical protein